MGILCNFYAIDHLVLSDASMLNKLSPFFAVICSYFVLKEKVKPFQALAVIVAFIGALFIIKPQSISASLPSFVGMLGGFGAGVARIFICTGKRNIGVRLYANNICGTYGVYSIRRYSR